MAQKSMLERLREEQQKLKNNSSKNNGFFKLPKSDEAEVKIRILPAKNFYTSDTPDLFYKRFGIHWINKQRIICPKITKGNACPICETVSDLYNSGSEEDLMAAKEFRVKKRTWVNIVEVLPNGYGEPKVFEFGPKLLDNILRWSLDPEYYDLSDPEKGYDFKIIKDKKDGFPNYDASKPVKNPSKIGTKEQTQELLDKVADIHSIIDKQVKSYDEIKAIFNLETTTVSDDSTEAEIEDLDQDKLLKRINERFGDND